MSKKRLQIIKCNDIIRVLMRPHGQAVKTLPSHGGNWGSIPHGATKTHFQSGFFYVFL